MVLDAAGRVGSGNELRDTTAKKGSGRIIPLHPDLRGALVAWRRASRRTANGSGAFARRSFLTCRPLRPRGVRTSSCPVHRCRHGLRHSSTAWYSQCSHYPFRVGLQFRGFSGSHFATAYCQVARSPNGSDRKVQSTGAFTCQAFSGVGHPRRCWLYDSTTSTGLLCRPGLAPARTAVSLGLHATGRSESCRVGLSPTGKSQTFARRTFK